MSSNTSTPFIVKVQRSVTTSEPVPQCLMYNRDRSVQHISDLSTDVARILGDRLKAFFWARLEPDGFSDGRKTLVIGDEAEWQEW